MSLVTFISFCGVVVLLQALEQKVWSLKFYKTTTGIYQEGHLEFSATLLQPKVWFKCECVVVDIHRISMSEPVNHWKKDIKLTFTLKQSNLAVLCRALEQ